MNVYYRARAPRPRRAVPRDRPELLLMRRFLAAGQAGAGRVPRLRRSRHRRHRLGHRRAAAVAARRRPRAAGERARHRRRPGRAHPRVRPGLRRRTSTRSSRWPTGSSAAWATGRSPPTCPRSSPAASSAPSLANLMFGLDAVSISTHHRSSGGLWLSEALATFGLVVLSSAWCAPAGRRWRRSPSAPTSPRRTGGRRRRASPTR